MVLSREYLESFVCERFRNDPHYRAGHIHILAPSSGTEILGLHTPVMKKIAKEIARSDSWKESSGNETRSHDRLKSNRSIRISWKFP